MSSEIRVNQIQNRSGLSTTILTDSGVTITGILTVSENLNVGGVLTYEDVANVDSIGIITARGGINVTGGSIGINTTGGNEKFNVFGAIRSSGSSTNFNAGLEGTLVDYDIPNRTSRIGHVNGASGSARSLAFLTGGTEKMRIDNNGRVIVNSNTSVGDQEEFQVVGVDDRNAMGISRFSASANAPDLTFFKSRSGTIGTNVIPNNQDNLGHISFKAYDGAAIRTAANITARVDGVPGSGNMPGELFFQTNGGSASVTHRLTLNKDGHLHPATDNQYNLGTTALRWANIFTNDLNLSNKGSTNSVDNTWGDYTIQEGENDLFLINNRSGKKFKFNLTEVL